MCTRRKWSVNSPAAYSASSNGLLGRNRLGTFATTYPSTSGKRAPAATRAKQARIARFGSSIRAIVGSPKELA
jgi:hypothetical protein